MKRSGNAILIATAFGLGIYLAAAGAGASAIAQDASQDAASKPEKEMKYSSETGLEFLRLAAGECWIGSDDSEVGHKDNESPRHKITLTKDFFISVHEVSQGQWKAVMDTAPWSGNDFNKSGDNFPASYMTHEEATEFCKKLSKMEGRTFRLPTAAEWEYACRAGTDTPYCYGDDAEELEDYDWFADNCRVPGRLERYPHELGQKEPNAWGLYGMHGNVSEWVIDWFDQYGRGDATDPVKKRQGNAQFRTARGGSWFADAESCRSAMRQGLPASRGAHYLGFRVVLEAPEPSAED